MNTRALAVYIKRGKVLAEGEDIDDEVPQNDLFIQKRSTKKVIHDIATDKKEIAPKPEKREGKRKPSSIKKKKQKKNPRNISKKSDREQPHKVSNVPPALTPEQIQEKERKNKEVQEVFDLDKKRKQADLAKSEEELEMLRLKRAKSVGDVVPTDVIKTLIVLFSENVKNQYIESAENFLVIISQGKEFSSSEVSKYRSQLVLLVNRAVDGAIDSTKRNLKNIIEASSQKRGVGQHD